MLGFLIAWATGNLDKYYTEQQKKKCDSCGKKKIKMSIKIKQYGLGD